MMNNQIDNRIFLISSVNQKFRLLIAYVSAMQGGYAPHTDTWQFYVDKQAEYLRQIDSLHQLDLNQLKSLNHELNPKVKAVYHAR